MKLLYLVVLCCAAAMSLPAAEPVAVFASEELGDAPVAPERAHVLAASAAGQTSITNFININSRETARQFFNTVFAASENVPMDWSGSYVTGTPGTNSTEYLRAVMRRVNYFRAMAGVPSSITFSNEYSRKAQAAALMMGGNNQIDHFPPTNWLYYTADGAEAARNSNLSLGNAGPQAVVGQMRDNGGNNYFAGHRRWILYPQTQVMGSGNVPATGTNLAAGVLWVFDTHTFDPRPATRDPFVSWPPPGYVPYQVAYARWSFAFPNADFSLAAVSMTSNGVPLSVSIEALANGYGDNTLVWIPGGLDANNLSAFAKPAADTLYHVTISNVKIGGTPQTFNYDVRIFDPAVVGADYAPVQISGPAQPYLNASNAYTFTSVTNATAYEWRQSRLTNSTFFDGAENNLTNFVVDASTNLYTIRDTAVKLTGTASFHLAHTQAVSQTLTINRQFVAATNSAVQFQSRLGWATADQVARVQVSLDAGTSWNDIYTQPGNNGSGEAAFNFRNLSLAPYAGRTVMVRLNYDFTFGPNGYYYQVSSGVGWYIDNLAVTNAQQIVSSSVAPALTANSFVFQPTNNGPYLLEARPLLFGDYPGEWGTGYIVNAVANTNPVVRITSMTKAAATTWNVDFTLQSGTPSSFELWSSTSLPAGFTRELSATIQTITPGSKYRAVVSSAATQKFFLVKPLP